MSAPQGAARSAGRFVPVSEDRCGQKRRLGPASYLHEFLISRQTAANGQINRGRAISYAWILLHWPGNPDERPSSRTLKRWMARLKAAGAVRVRHCRMNAGMYVELIGSVKFAPASRRPAEQIPMFDAPLRFPLSAPRPVENPVEIGSTRRDRSGTFVGPEVAPESSKEEIPKKSATAYAAVAAETTRANTARGIPPPDQAARDFRRRQMQRRLLGEVTRIQECYAGEQDRESLERRDLRLGALYRQLGTTGWQDERDG